MSGRKIMLLCVLFLTAWWLSVTPTRAAPLQQESDEAILRVINESEETICYVMVCPSTAKDADDCLIEMDPIVSGEIRAFNMESGNYNAVLVDCEGVFVLAESEIIIIEQHELRFIGPNCEALSQRGVNLHRRGEFHEALTQFENALTCYRQTGDRQGECGALSNLGIAYRSTGQYMIALDYCEQALAIAQDLDDRNVESAALGNLGTVYYYLGQYAMAIEYHELALSINKNIGHRRGEGGSLINLGIAYRELGKYMTAIEYYEQALVIAQYLADRNMEGRALGNLGIAYESLGQYATAIDYHEQALIVSQEISDRQGEGSRLGNLGNVYSSMGQYMTAIDYFEQTLFIAQDIGDRNMEGRALGNLGIAYDSLGQYVIAIDYYEQALVVAQEIGDRQGEGNRLSNLGNTYRSMGQYTTAINYSEQALAIAQEIGDQRSATNRLSNLGIAYDSLGQYATAIEYYKQALNIAQEIGYRQGEGSVLGNLGIAYNSLGQHATAITYYKQALSIALEIGDRQNEGTHLGNLGIAYGSLGQTTTAIDYYEQALAIAREIGDRQNEGTHLGNLGLAYRNLGQYAEALDYYEQSIAVWETLREEIRVEEWKSSFTAENTGPYRGIIQVLLELNHPDEAFHYAQRAKARTFLDQIGNARVDPRATDDPKLIEQEQSLLAEIRGLEAVLSGRQDFASVGDTRGGGSSTLTTEQETEIKTRLEAAYREYEHLLAQIKRTNPEYAALRTVQASTLITVQQTLPPEVTLVEYYVVSSTQTLAFVVTRDAFHTIPLSVTHQAVSAELERFEAESQTSLSGVPGSLQTLYAWLFAPLREVVTTPVLLLAPHQQLHYLPFAALHDGAHYLVEDYVILYTPSASVLEYLIQNAADVAEGGALILGNPANPEVSRLPGAEREAQAIADLLGARAFLGADATEARLWEQAAGQRYVHLAAHGSFNPVAPQFSRLYLAPGGAEALPAERRDGFLEAREVWNLPLESAQLVALSACQTQVGDLSAGDEWAGLSRAFIYAGTSGLVASLWNVEDASTAHLMTAFYARVEAGEDPAVALRAAQLALLNDSQYAHPYHWAAFNYTGAPPSSALSDPPEPPATSGGGLCASAALPLALLALAWVWRRR